MKKLILKRWRDGWNNKSTWQLAGLLTESKFGHELKYVIKLNIQ